jgi:hypothetical protein
MHSRVAAAAIDKAKTEEGEEVKLFHHYQSRLEANTTVMLAVTYLLSGWFPFAFISWVYYATSFPSLTIIRPVCDYFWRSGELSLQIYIGSDIHKEENIPTYGPYNNDQALWRAEIWFINRCSNIKHQLFECEHCVSGFSYPISQLLVM